MKLVRVIVWTLFAGVGLCNGCSVFVTIVWQMRAVMFQLFRLITYHFSEKRNTYFLVYYFQNFIALDLRLPTTML